MRIGIDARMLASGFGLGRYAQQLVLHLQKIDKENQYVLFLRKENFNSVKFDNKNFKRVLADIPWYSAEEQINFLKIIKDEKVDLMHFLHWNVPLLYNNHFVVTIHDLIMFHFPRPEATTLGPVKYFVKDVAHRTVVKHAVKKSRHILAMSEFTKQDVCNVFGVDREKITVTYQAPFCMPEADLRANNILQKFKIEKPFVLYVGSAYPHKNLKGLLKAWKMFIDKYGNNYQLVLVGGDSYFYDLLKKSDEARGLREIPVFTGFLDDNELSQLYQKAKLYIFPSFYEGFGLPPLEAMTHNVPVVSSNRSCLPEVLGEAALYFDPENIEQISETINHGLTDENARFDLRVKAREELRRYSWDNLTKQTLEVYKKSLN